MSYGSVDHLWIHGQPGPDAVTLRAWIDAIFPQTFLARIGYQREEVVLEVHQLGPALTLVDLQERGRLEKATPVAARSPIAEEIDLLDALATSAVKAGFDCTRIAMGDGGPMVWRVETLGKSAAGARMDEPEDDAPDDEKIFRTLAPGGEWSVNDGAPSLARDLIHRVVDLPLKEVYHYIDWSYAAREALAKNAPIEGFASATLARVHPPLTLVWEAKRL